jgi:NTP pyrophosphatase (non-canonical NTP hydrolase)
VIVEEKIKECLIDGKKWFDMEPGTDRSLFYHAFGLGGETGEVLDIIKKSMRGEEGLTQGDICKLQEEMIDVFVHWCNLWGQLAMLSTINGSPTTIYDRKRKFNVERFDA